MPPLNSGSRTAILFAATLVTLAGTANAQTYTAYLTGAQEVPVAATTATGYSRIQIKESTGELTYLVVFNGLSSAQIAAHIHAPAPVGSNVGVAINFGAVGGTSGTISGTTTITPTQIAHVRAGLAYVNVHSANFPGGEIRGQLANARLVVDYDGDGKTDHSILRFSNTTPNPITYYNLNSTAGFQAVNWGDADFDVPTPGDYDGDGRDDVAIYREGTTAGAPSLFFVLQSSNGAVQTTQWGVRGDQAVNRDYDGDGKTDIAIFRRGAAASSPAVWWIRESSGGVRIVHWGTTGTESGGDVPVPDDYDGDGKTDVAIYRYGSLSPANTFIVQRSSDGGATYQQFGSFTTDYVVPGDYDGDGKGDYAVARTGASGTAAMVWFILKSSNQQVSIVSFGFSADQPTPGDYDGDGTTDIAVYRQGATTSQSTFWALGSSTNGVLALAWGLGGDYPVATSLVYRPVVVAGVLPANVPVSDTIDPVGDLDLFNFTLVTSTRVVLQATRTGGSMDPCLRLLTGPSGPPVTGGTVCGSTARLDLVLEAGTYFVEVSDFFDDETGTYTLLYQPIVVASAVPLVADVPVSDTVSPLGDLDLFTFTLATSTRVVLQATQTGGSIDPCVRLMTGPGGPPVTGGTVCGSTARLDLVLEAGTYFVEVSDFFNDETGTYTLLYQPIVARAGPPVADVPSSDILSPLGAWIASPSRWQR